MATPIDQSRNKRTWAKGAVTKVATQIKSLEAVALSSLDADAITKLIEALGKAEETFETHHTIIYELEGGDAQIFQDELGSHQELVNAHKKSLRCMLHGAEASELVEGMEESLDAMERAGSRKYCPAHDEELARVTRLVQDFRDARNKRGACTDPALKSIRDRALSRLENLTQIHTASKDAVTTPEVAPVREPTSTPRRLKIPPPVFDGTILGWKHFWNLFSALLDRETSMADVDKCCLLVEAMGTPEAKTTVLKATANSATFAEAVVTLKSIYDKNRVVHGHHYGEMCRTDLFGDTYDDVTRLWDRIRDCRRGMTLSKGYTADQIVTVHFERLMKPSLMRRWMDFTPSHKATPPVDVLLEFLEQQKTSTATVSTMPREYVVSSPPIVQSKARIATAKPVNKSMHVIQAAPTRTDKCRYCSADHSVFSCESFKGLDVNQRWAWVKKSGRCYNCLSHNHQLASCATPHRCKQCSSNHHTLLHTAAGEHPQTEDTDSHPIGVISKLTSGQPAYPLPRTAVVGIQARSLFQKARAQLDSGASVSLITSSLAQTLGARPIPHSQATMVGVGGVTYTSLHTVKAVLIGNQGEELRTLFHVVESISPTDSRTDMRRVRRLPFLKRLHLSDPHYNPSSRIDVLMDMGSTNACFINEARFSASGLLRAQNSIFGWTVGGHDSSNITPSDVQPTLMKLAVESTLEPLLLKFWEQERISTDDQSLSCDEQQAVSHFQDHLTRDEDGRYRVSLPRRQPTPELGRSRSTALRRFVHNESSLRKRGMWSQFHPAITEYGEMGHAERVPESDMRLPAAATFYLPMHGVVKDSSSTTKLRLVFDASARSSTGVSLNDTLLPGPSLYPLLTSVLTRFRTHPIGMTSDISKMFREIGLNTCEQNYHRFLQRGPEGDIQDWRMSRLTFGVTSSPFLATQVLHQLADDYTLEHPKAAETIRSSFYVDDCLTGAEDLRQAVQLREELNQLCSKALMTLRKWRSNSSDLMNTIPLELRESSDLRIVSTPGEHAKTLGLHWGTASDCFYVSTPDVDIAKTPTRRLIASTIARTFDAMGWFSPALLPAKVLLKKTWTMKLGWDDPLSPPLLPSWKSWAVNLSAITSCPVPRFMGLPGQTAAEVQLHAFSDASLLAYGGVVYRRTTYSTGQIVVDIVASKSRVTPLKWTSDTSQSVQPDSQFPVKVVKEVSMPRLELCGALVAAQLLSAVAADLQNPTTSLYAWCDSSSVLGWINKSPSLLSIYVANRIIKLTNLAPSRLWRYVCTADNPADYLSRGMNPKELSETKMWWKGPSWLSLEEKEWPRRPDINMDRELSEVKGTVMRVNLAPDEIGCQISSYDRLVRVMAQVTRFIQRISKQRTPIPKSYITLKEYRSAEALVTKLSQSHSFTEVIRALKDRKKLHKRHPLAPLAPYIDEDGILRVGGRLQNAELESACTHPIILHHRSHIVLLFIRKIHQQLMHAGPSTIMATIAATHHIPRIRGLVRSLSRSCVTCQKIYARTASQQMGQLPSSRTQPSFPFGTVGIDFAGPIWIKRGNPRKPTILKSYLCVFIDFTCRATHLEVVSDMTTEAFLAALSRFVGRRGIPTTVYTDNGSNFLGADSELRKMLDLLKSESSRQALEYWASQQHVDWRFSPARAPHFGGLWEATVKLAKRLIRKAVGERRLNFEELTTFAVAAEAVINSRPLVPLNSTSDDAIAALTPGHFLIGRPLKAMPSVPDLSPVLSHIRRWNLVSRLIHDFWERWRPEYLLLLQRRNKWHHPQRNLEKGDVVLIKDQDTFQRVWPMGLITAVFPGKDGLVRVAEVRSQGKVLRRPIHKLVPLLSEYSTPASSGGECSGRTASGEASPSS